MSINLNGLSTYSAPNISNLQVTSTTIYNGLGTFIKHYLINLIGCNGLLAELGIRRTRASSVTAAGSDTQSRGLGTTTQDYGYAFNSSRSASATGARPQQRSGPVPRSTNAGRVGLYTLGASQAGTMGADAGSATTRRLGTCQAGTVCSIAGSTTNHRPGSAGRCQAPGTACPIAGYATYRRAGVFRRPGSPCRYQTGTVCSIAGSATARRPGLNRRPGSTGRGPPDLRTEGKRT
jgi:hypothetical protein